MFKESKQLVETDWCYSVLKSWTNIPLYSTSSEVLLRCYISSNSILSAHKVNQVWRPSALGVLEAKRCLDATIWKLTALPRSTGIQPMTIRNERLPFLLFTPTLQYRSYFDFFYSFVIDIKCIRSSISVMTWSISHKTKEVLLLVELTSL